MINYRLHISSVLSLCMISSAVLAYTAPVENRESINGDEGWGRQNYVSAESDTPVSGIAVNQAPDSTDNQPGYLGRLSELEKELRELRGQVEEQSHKIKQMASLQRQLFQDLDSRVDALTSANAVSPANAPVARQAAVPVGNEQSTYQTAYDLLKNKQFAQAKQAMNLYLKQFPNGQYAVNAYYWVGELSLLTGDNKDAAKAFATVIDKYPTSSKVSDAMLKMGIIYLDKGNQSAAKKQFQKIVQSFPNSASANIARRRLQQL